MFFIAIKVNVLSWYGNLVSEADLEIVIYSTREKKGLFQSRYKNSLRERQSNTIRPRAKPVFFVFLRRSRGLFLYREGSPFTALAAYNILYIERL